MSKKKCRKYKLLKSLCKEILANLQPLFDEDLDREFQDPGRYILDYKLVNKLRSTFPIKSST